MKFAAKALVAALFAAAAALPGPVAAKDGKNAALLGGLAAGALVGGVVGNAVGANGAQQQPQDDYEEPRPVRRRAQPVYQEPLAEASDDCHFERRKVYDEDGNLRGTRRVRVCD